MNYILKPKYTIRLTITIILIIMLFPSYFSFANSNQWDNKWSYSQEIKIPFDTNLEIAKFQPIDIKVDFQNPCWTKNDLEHSIRIVCWDGNSWHELESQIYSLEPSKEMLFMKNSVLFEESFNIISCVIALGNLTEKIKSFGVSSFHFLIVVCFGIL